MGRRQPRASRDVLGEPGKSAAGSAGPEAEEEVGPSGLPRWVDEPVAAVASGPSWLSILTHWPAVEADLQEIYGIDVEDDALMRSHSWRWLAVRVRGLLDRPPVFVAYQSGEHTRFSAVPSTRIGYLLNAPKFE